MAKTYDSYKDSGIAWIGEIPSEWGVCRIKDIYQERSETTETGTERLLSVSEYYGVAPTADKIEDGDYLTRAESLIGYKKCYKDDFVSNIMLAWKGSFGTTKYDGIVSPAYCVYKPVSTISPEYYHYLFRTDLYKSRFKSYSKGIIDSRLRLYTPFFYLVDAILPPLSEQQSIASFLDTKCGEIDSLISLQEEMISELQAYKQSVITEAVTKGLDPNAKMKDSGVEWIGEIPENWKVSKVGLQYNVILGKMLCPKQLNDDYTLEKYYCAANVHFNGIEGELKKMWFSSLDKETYLTKKGDLLVVEGGAGAGGCAIVNDDESPVYIQNSIMIVRPKLINDVRYLRYQIEQFVKRGYIDVVCNKATIPHFTKDKVSNMQIPLPSFEVQQQIANYLDDKTSQIDSLISLKQQKIDELKSYKKSIIYEYVTGKKRV